MEQYALTSDDLENLPAMSQPLTRKDWVRLLRSALEKNPEPVIAKTCQLLLQSLLVDSGFGATLRAELAQELSMASPLELMVMREALLSCRTPKTSTSTESTSEAGTEERSDEPA